MSRRTLRVLGALLGLLVSLTGCLVDSPRPLTRAELDAYIHRFQLPRPRAIETVGGAVTVALIDSPTEKGCAYGTAYGAVGNHSGGFYRATVRIPAKVQAPVVVTDGWYHVSIICIIVNDPALRQRLTRITVIYEDGRVAGQDVDGRGAYVITRPERGDYRQLVFMDAVGQALYRWPVAAPMDTPTAP